jgi:hypothetical protein
MFSSSMFFENDVWRKCEEKFRNLVFSLTRSAAAGKKAAGRFHIIIKRAVIDSVTCLLDQDDERQGRTGVLPSASF